VHAFRALPFQLLILQTESHADAILDTGKLLGYVDKAILFSALGRVILRDHGWEAAMRTSVQTFRLTAVSRATDVYDAGAHRTLGVTGGPVQSAR
jgi:hypothetical protein